MKSIKGTIFQGLALVMCAAGITEIAVAAPKGLTVHNDTGNALCLAFVRTKSTATLKVSGNKGKKYEVLHEEGAINTQNDYIAPGQSTHFSGYESGGLKYDRVLWVVKDENADCNILVNIEKDKKKPAKATALYVGSATDVTIIEKSGKLDLKKTTQELKKDVSLRLDALKKALQGAGIGWEDFKNNVTAYNWNTVKAAFERAYKDAKRNASKAGQKIYKAKAVKEVREREEGEPVEGWPGGVRPAMGMNEGEWPDQPEGQPGMSMKENDRNPQFRYNDRPR